MVGENPTGGIHLRQFENAVDWVKALSLKATGAKSGSSVRISPAPFLRWRRHCLQTV